MASNPGRIPAGGREKISIEVKTANRGGMKMHKGFTVFTNDPANPQVKLIVAGKVLGHISLSSRYIRFMGSEGQPMSKTIMIEPVNRHTFNIQEISAKDGKNLKLDWKPVDGDSNRKGYQLVVQNTLQFAGVYSDLITIKTDSKAKPILRIPVRGQIYKARGQNEPKQQ